MPKKRRVAGTAAAVAPAAAAAQAAAAAPAAAIPTAPPGLAPAALLEWWKRQIDGAAARHKRQLAELHAAHKVEMDALEGAQQAAAMAACGEDMSPCTMCKKALAEDDQLNCSECERVYCSDCGYGRGDFPRQCVDCDEFNCCKGIVVTHCHGGMVCARPLHSGFTLPRTQRDLKRSVVACIGPGEECVQNHKSGGNRGKRKGFTPDGCTCLLDSDDY